MIEALIFLLIILMCVVILLLTLLHSRDNKRAYFDGYKKGFSDAKFLSKIEHERHINYK